jgi:2'-5' RNA ligase
MERALVLVIDDAEPFDEVRREFAGWDVARGLPFHVTLLWPFGETVELAAEARAFFAARAPFEFSLTRIASWPRVVYAVPEPDAQLLDCMRALHARFPKWPPYRDIHDEIVPHATLGHDVDAVLIRAEIERRLAPYLPHRCQARDVSLLEEFEPDRWREFERLPFAD